MKNKEYRIKHRPGQNIELVEMDINTKKALTKRNQNYKPITNLKEKELFNSGYNLGIENTTLDKNDTRLNNIYFKRGYLLGIRQYLVEEEQKVRNQITTLVENNISLEKCPEHIQNNQLYRTTYMLEKIKQRNRK